MSFAVPNPSFGLHCVEIRRHAAFPMGMRFALCLAVGGLLQGSVLAAAEIRMIDGSDVRVEKMAADINTPWGLAFLPGCAFLVTERGGSLIFVGADGSRHEVSGVPEVSGGGQGGLLDIEAANDFTLSRTIFLTYSTGISGDSSGTALSRAQLSEDGRALENVRLLFRMRPGISGGRHFGSRVAEAPDGMLFLTIGDRGDRESAQDLSTHNGTIVRVRRDGTVPDDNPFARTPDALPEIWSYGHRNPQGAAFDEKGNLWISEHGARGGDEINLIRRGHNYGWPEISYGVHYNGRRIGSGTVKEGMEQPEYFWDPSIAPAGMDVYSGKLWSKWRNQLFVGSLKFDYISRLSADGGMREVEQIRFPETARVRDVQEAPDGTIWFTSEGRRAVYRVSPAGPGVDTEASCAWQASS